MATHAPKMGAPFRSALTKFRARLSGNQLLDFQNTTYEQLCRDMMRLQHEQENRKVMMNLARLQSCLEAMHQFGKTIEIFLNVSDAVAFVWGPIKFLLLTASNFVDSFEALLDAYEQIGEILPLLSEYETLFGEDDRMLNALELLYIDVLEFHGRALRFFEGRAWKKVFKSIWKDYHTQFDGTLRRLKRHSDMIQTRASLHQSFRYQKDIPKIQSILDQHYDKYLQDIPQIQKQLDDLVAEDRDKKRIVVKQWLASGNMLADHYNHLATRERYPNTGNWILKHDVISHWMNQDIPTSPIVWMHGIPGAGKTVLASIVIEECKKKGDFLTTYFYCHYAAPEKKTAVGVLRGLLEQLVDQHDDMIPYCYTRRANIGGDPVLSHFNWARKLFEDFCNIVEKQFIIIDGIDECEAAERRQLLEFLVQIIGQCDSQAPGSLRVLFISQEYPDIKRALHSSSLTRVPPSTLSLTVKDNEGDIITYVKDLAIQIQEKYELNEDQVEYLKNLSVHRAQGMFLYVVLVLPNLLKLTTREELFAEIHKGRFPKGLEDAYSYERILSRIKNTSVEVQWNQARKLLGWMVCAKRQLTLREIQTALSIDLDEQTIHYDDRRLRTHIRDICGSLVQLNGDRVTLVHSTAKQYITKCSKDIHEPSIECDLAVLCLRYLTFECFGDDKSIDKPTLRQLAMKGHFALQDYAVAKWFHHVDAFIKTGSDLLQNGPDVRKRLDAMAIALDDFKVRYEEEDWDIVNMCKDNCQEFRNEEFYENLVIIASHIYMFQKKGSDARHVVNITSLSNALERNRNMLEEMVGNKKKSALSESDLKIYRQFYDVQRPFKCNKITCLYFSEGFKEAKARKKHIAQHDRPFHCEVPDCLAHEHGFSNEKDLEKHLRTFHPETSDLAESFKPSTASGAKREFRCEICGKQFTRSFHKKNHEMAHRGERPHECPECGKAFTRLNDCKRHQKLHDRN